MTAPLYTDIANAPEGGHARFLETRDGMRIRVGIWPVGHKGTVLIFTGRTEYIEKYGPVVGRLKALGWSSVVIDWRGQGLATRVHDTTDVGHVEQFDDYQLDIDAVLECEAVQALPQPMVLLAHSMGGAIGLRALHQRLPVVGAIFSAPMWDFKMSPLFRTFACLVTGTLTKFGQGAKHVLGASSDFYVTKAPFAENELTNCSKTYAWLKDNVERHPDLGLGGPSNNWTYRGFQESDALMTKIPPKQPTLTFFGDQETIVCPDAIRGYHAKPGSGRLFRIDGAKHEILMDTDATSAPAWDEIAAFLDSHA